MLGNKIKQLRKSHKMTQTELGKILNVEKSTISMYENNNSLPPIDTIMTMAKYFDVSLDYLMGNEKNMLTEKDEKDIAKTMEKLRQQLQEPQGIMFDGEYLDEATIEFLLEELERQERLVKTINKKYIPKKFRK